MALEKAKLFKLANQAEPEVVEQTIAVQFNPASLKLTLSNSTEGGQQQGRQQRQFTGNSSTELAFDLEFDTADEVDESGNAVDVRVKTALIEQFVLAQGTPEKRQSPPRVRFEWGKLSIAGVITQLSIDFDLFAENGFPLHAKMSVSIKEQNAQYEIRTRGKGEGQAPEPGDSGAGPGSSNRQEKDRTGVALAGESLAEFGVRMGLDAGAWRGLAGGLEAGLSLSAGMEIDFSSSLSLGAGIGVSAGFQADVGVSLEASLGLEASASLSAGVSAGAGASASAGFALSAAGGVGAAVETVQIARAQAAADASIRSFGASGVATARAAVGTGGVAALASGAVVGASAAAAASSAASLQARGAAGAVVQSITSAAPADRSSALPRAYAPPRVDARAVSFGYGVPLRARVSGAADTRSGVVALRPYASARDVPVTRDPTTPAWEQLPAARAGGPSTGATPVRGRPAASSPASAAGGAAPSKAAPRRRTGCGCGCGPGKAGR
ncbi:MAG TPA: hypothetical protein VF665_05690 [Longimicrobium sp.]|jgi:hypothetical protein|uniref:CIS tube protein n=1 Tax=Longimicrobium sp. TaxID=2029185 RepID=UPI002ED93ACB